MLLPVISFDAAHMKGLGDRIAIGKTYLAVAPDGDNNIHLCSIGHGSNEATDSWKLFLAPILKFRQEMKSDMEDKEPVAIADEHATITTLRARST